jgi:lactam utilization protein B
MQSSDVKFPHLDSATAESFLDALRTRGVRRVPGPRGLRPLLDYLDSEGALAFKPVPDSPVERLVAEYSFMIPTTLRFAVFSKATVAHARSSSSMTVRGVAWAARTVAICSGTLASRVAAGAKRYQHRQQHEHVAILPAATIAKHTEPRTHRL